VNAAVSDGALVSPEQIGYLHSIGVDYGWGPTTMIQWMLEHVHVYSGLPWWGSIMVTALGFRLAMFPLFVKAADAGARSMAIVPVTNPLMEQMKIAQKSGKSAEAAMYMQKVMAIRKEAGASVFAPFVPLVLQGIFGYCGFKLMHHLATLPVPEFHDGGFGWIQDLTLTDGYLIIPAFMSVILHLTVRLGGESGNRQVLPPAMMNIMLWGMPGIMFFFLAWQPAAVALWFLTTGGVSITQGQLLQRPAVREALGIAPIIKLEGSSNLIADFFATAEKKDEKKKNTFKIEDLNDLNESLTKGDFSYQAPTLKTRAPSPDKVIDAKLVPKRGPSKS
jgi:YidC/Oxa1 family membrane protein insertase